MSTIGVKAIKYPDGDSAVNITDGGNVTLAGTLGVTGTSTLSSGLVMTSDDPTITMTDSSGTNDIGTIQSASGALILTARDGSSDGEIIFKKTDGSATDETLRIKNSGNIGIGTNDPATLLHIENSSGNGSLQITSSTSGTSFINMGDTGDPDDGQISYLNSDLSMRFTTNAAEQVRIPVSYTHLTLPTNREV